MYNFTITTPYKIDTYGPYFSEEAMRRVKLAIESFYTPEVRASWELPDEIDWIIPHNQLERYAIAAVLGWREIPREDYEKYGSSRYGGYVLWIPPETPEEEISKRMWYLPSLEELKADLLARFGVGK